MELNQDELVILINALEFFNTEFPYDMEAEEALLKRLKDQYKGAK